MEKVVRIYNSSKEQEQARIDDIQLMSPNNRVAMLLEMQALYFDLKNNCKIERVLKVKRLEFI